MVGDAPSAGQEDNRRVYFWYYEGGTWNYYNKQFPDFVVNEYGESEECGNDTLIPDSIKEQLSKDYFENNVNKNEDDFMQVKKQYNPKYAAPFQQSVHLVKSYDTLTTGLMYQKGGELTDSNPLRPLFEFPPILIYGAKGENVYYYYLTYNGTNFSFKSGYEDLSDFGNDMIAVLRGIQDKINFDPKSQEQKNNIREAALRDVSPEHLEFIKTIYHEHPLSASQVFFMKKLFGDDANNSYGKNRFGSSCGATKNYVETKFGPITASKFGATIIKSKYGANTIALTPK